MKNEFAAKSRVAVVLVHVALEGVGARRRHHAHLRRAARVVGALHGRGDRELPDVVGRRAVRDEVQRVGPDEVVLDVDAVLRQLGPGRPAAIDAVLRSADAGDARHQPDQLDRVAAVERQRLDLLLVDGLVTSGVVVGTSDEPASTLTTSLTLPSASFAVIEYSWPTAMLIPVKLALLKLGSETSSL